MGGPVSRGALAMFTTKSRQGTSGVTANCKQGQHTFQAVRGKWVPHESKATPSRQ